MQRFLTASIWLVSTCYCFTSQAALNFFPTGQYAISAQVGPSKLNIGNSTLAVTPTETDTLHETNNEFTPEFSLGINYLIPLNLNLKKIGLNFSPYLQPEINLRGFNQTIDGQVYQYQEAIMNNYNYTLTLNSLRLMLDLKVGLLTFDEKWRLYLLGGIGYVLNQLDYEDTPIPGVEGGSLSLNKHNTSGLAYEIGAGILYSIDCLMDVFLEYRYAKFPTLRTSSSGTLNGEPAQVGSANFPFSSNTLSFGINWKIQ